MKKLTKLTQFTQFTHIKYMSSLESKTKLTTQLSEQLKSGLDELKQSSMPGSKIRWNDDGWCNLRDDKLLEKWELLRKVKSREVSSTNSIELAENNTFNNILTKLFNTKSPSEIKVEDKEIKLLADNLNPIFSNFKEQINNNNLNTTKNLSSTESLNNNTIINSDIIQIKDGKLIIDIDQTNEIVSKTIKLILDNRRRHTTLIGGLSIGIGGGLLYRAVINSYSKTLESIIKNAKIENMSNNFREEFIKNITANKSTFNKSGGVLITIALYVMIQAFSSKHPFTFAIDGDNSSKNLEKMNSNSMNNSIFSLIFKNKLPPEAWLQYIIILIICLINVYIFIYYINPFISTFINIKLIKIIVIFIIFITILYYLYSVYFLINVSDKNIFTQKIDFLPKKYQNHINWLKNIKNSSVAKFYIQLYLTNAIYMFILLLLFIFITSLLDFL